MRRLVTMHQRSPSGWFPRRPYQPSSETSAIKLPSPSIQRVASLTNPVSLDQARFGPLTGASTVWSRDGAAVALLCPKRD